MIMDDPFENYPDLIKEREKARKLLAKEEKLGRLPGRKGGWRPNAGPKPRDYKVYRVSFTILKTDEELVSKEVTLLKEKYGYQC